MSGVTHAVVHAFFHVAGSVLHPFAKGYLNSEYRTKLHVSRFQDQLTLVYARANATPVVIPVSEAIKLDVETLGRWFHCEVALLHRRKPVPQLDKFVEAAKEAHALAHSKTPVTPGSVLRYGTFVPAVYNPL